MLAGISPYIKSLVRLCMSPKLCTHMYLYTHIYLYALYVLLQDSFLLLNSYIYLAFNYTLKVFKNGQLLASFFVFSIQLTLNVQLKFCRRLDMNRGPLESEATALPTEPLPIP